MLGNVPRAVLRVEDGQHVDSNDPVRRRVLSENDAATVTSILEGVVREGTGKRAQLVGREEAGKTGTTENYGDAWFVGYTPELAVAVWVGYPNRLKPMTNEFEGGPVAGGTYPALIWKTFMKKALKRLDLPAEPFPVPDYQNVYPVQVVNRGNHLLLDNGNCDDARVIVYYAGAEPEQAGRVQAERGRRSARRRSRRDLAETKLLSTPLTPELIWRPAEFGEQLGRVTAQIPARGTLSSWNTVRIVLPRAVHGRIPDVVGLPLDRARRKLARRHLAGVVQALTDASPAGVVISQVPRAGRAAAPNLTVNLVASARLRKREPASP